MAEPGDTGLLRVFEPDDPREAGQGWALHATRRRVIHEAEARHLDRWRYVLGIASTCLAAVAGTSAFAAWQSDTDNTAAAVVTAVVGIGAAILASILTFLDLGARAEANRRAASAYKGVLRDYEEAWSLRKEGQRALDPAALGALKRALAEADAAAPTVPVRRGAAVEGAPFDFVGTADELAPNPARPGRAGQARRAG
jgi:hypothetical protein